MPRDIFSALIYLVVIPIKVLTTVIDTSVVIKNEILFQRRNQLTSN